MKRTSLMRTLKLATTILIFNSSTIAYSDTAYKNIFLSYIDPDTSFTGGLSPSNLTELQTILSTTTRDNSPLNKFEKTDSKFMSYQGAFIWELRYDCFGSNNPKINCQADDSMLKKIHDYYQTKKAATITDQHPKVGAYYTQWSGYGGEVPVTLEDLTPLAQYVDIIYYAFFSPEDLKGNVGLYSSEPWTGKDSDTFKTLENNSSWSNKEKFLSIGGATYSRALTNAISTAANRQKLVTSIKQCLNGSTYNADGTQDAGKCIKFDGIDIDYEDPEATPEDWENMYLFLQQLKDGTPELLNKKVTLTILANPDKMNENESSLAQINYLLSNNGKNPEQGWMNVMTYDYHGVFDSTTAFPGGGSNYTGFLANYMQPTSIHGFQIDRNSLVEDPPSNIDKCLSDPDNVICKYNTIESLQTLISLTPQEGDLLQEPMSISVGIPAYGRAIQYIQDPSAFPPFPIYQPIGNQVPGGIFESNSMMGCINNIESGYTTTPGINISNYCVNGKKVRLGKVPVTHNYQCPIYCTGTIPYNQIKTQNINTKPILFFGPNLACGNDKDIQKCYSSSYAHNIYASVLDLRDIELGGCDKSNLVAPKDNWSSYTC